MMRSNLLKESAAFTQNNVQLGQTAMQNREMDLNPIPQDTTELNKVPTRDMEKELPYLEQADVPDGNYFNAMGEWLGTEGENPTNVYLADAKQTDGSYSNAKLLTIDLKELLDRSTWVFGECGGSDELITVRTQNAGSADSVTDAKVVSYYAHAINNAAAKDGGFYKAAQNRMGKIIKGKYTKTYEGYFEGTGLGGNTHSKAFANNRITGLTELMGLSNAKNAIATVIATVNGETDPSGGARAWLGSSAAKPYVENAAKKTSGAVLQFSFTSKNKTYYHSFYRK